MYTHNYFSCLDVMLCYLSSIKKGTSASSQSFETELLNDIDITADLFSTFSLTLDPIPFGSFLGLSSICVGVGVVDIACYWTPLTCYNSGSCAHTHLVILQKWLNTKKECETCKYHCFRCCFLCFQADWRSWVQSLSWCPGADVLVTVEEHFSSRWLQTPYWQQG